SSDVCSPDLTHSCGETVAHRSQSAGRKEGARMIIMIVLGGPHLMLAYIGYHNSISVGGLRKLFNHMLGLDRIFRGGHFQRMIFFPLIDLGPPILKLVFRCLLIDSR